MTNYPTGPLPPPQMPAQPGQSEWRDLVTNIEKPEVPGQNEREFLKSDDCDDDDQSMYGL